MFTRVIPLSGKVEGFFVKQPFEQRQLTSLKTGEIKILYGANNTAMKPILGYKSFGQTDTMVNSLNKKYHCKYTPCVIISCLHLWGEF